MNFTFMGKDYEVKKFLNRPEQAVGIDNRYRKIQDKIVKANGGLTMLKPSEGIRLSKGCQACKEGRWWCLFMGNQCNSKCAFCPQDKTNEALNAWSHPRTIVKYWIDDVKAYADIFGNKLSGISYSGGEPMLYTDKIFEIAKHVSERQPQIYQWVYTNGIIATKPKMQKLKECGISEIRFDLAATDFSDKVLERVGQASHIFDRVTVEVPSTKEVRDRLIYHGMLNRIIELGVSQLNLAELQICQPYTFQKYGVDNDIYEYDTVFVSSIVACNSRHYTIDVMEYALDNNTPILINDCSMDAKNLQLAMRNLNCPIACK